MYTDESELLYAFVPGSIAACYIFVIVLGLILLLITKLFCRSGRVIYDMKNPASEAKKQVKNIEEGKGKDLIEFEKHLSSENKW